mgnify:CR=1 FL=1
MFYLLDTNILIAALKGQIAVKQRLETLALDKIRLSTVVLGELEFGAEKSAYCERNRARLTRMAQQLQLVGIDAATSRQYGLVRAHLEQQGTPIGANDTWIAAQALTINAILVTDNVREFSRVPNLQMENWLLLQ